MAPVELPPLELDRALSRRPSLVFDERHHGGAKTPNPASSNRGAPSRRKLRMPVASVVYSQGAAEASARPSGGTSRAAWPSPRRRCSSGCATWRPMAVSSGPSDQTSCAETTKLGSSTAWRAKSTCQLASVCGERCFFPLGLGRWRSRPSGVSSPSSEGGTIRKHVRTDSASTLLVPCHSAKTSRQLRCISSSAPSSPPSHSPMSPSGEPRALTQAAATLGIVSRWRARDGRGGVTTSSRTRASVIVHIIERRTSWLSAAPSWPGGISLFDPLARAAINEVGRAHASA